MTTPNVSLPSLRAFLGAIALERTTSQTANRSLYKLQGGLTDNDTQVRDVVNAAIDAIDAVDAGHSAIAIDLTGATPSYSLTAAQVRHSVLQLFGTHGAYLPVILPSDARGVWVVQNGSEQSVAVKIGGSDVPVLSGDSSVVFVNADGDIGAISASFDPASPGAIGGTTADVVHTTELRVQRPDDATEHVAVQSINEPDIEGNVTGTAGDLLLNYNNAEGQLWLKHTGVATSTGWRRMAFASEVPNLAAPGAIGGTTPAAGTFTGLTVSGLTASRYVVTDGSKALSSQSGVPLADLKNAGGAIGDLGVWNGSAWSRLVAVAQGQVLRSAGSGAAPDYGQIDNSHVGSAAAIAGTKISPAFGSQNISTTGTLSAGSSTLSAVNVSGLTASRYVMTDGSKNLVSQLTHADVAPIDSNHVGVWHLDSSDGSSFHSALTGGVAFSGGSSDVEAIETNLFKRTKSALYTGSSVFRKLTASGAFSLATTSAVTIEAYVIINLVGSGEWPTYHEFASVSGATDYLSIRIKNGSSSLAAFAHYNGGAVDGTISYGSSANQLAPDVPHHVMMVWTPGSSVVYYIDGFQFGSTSLNIARSTTITAAYLTLTAGISVGGFRVSNVARDAAYARAATRAMYLL